LCFNIRKYGKKTNFSKEGELFKRMILYWEPPNISPQVEGDIFDHGFFSLKNSAA
jgi:hypothetical protein